MNAGDEEARWKEGRARDWRALERVFFDPLAEKNRVARCGGMTRVLYLRSLSSTMMVAGTRSRSRGFESHKGGCWADDRGWHRERPSDVVLASLVSQQRAEDGQGQRCICVRHRRRRWWGTVTRRVGAEADFRNSAPRTPPARKRRNLLPWPQTRDL